MATIEERCFEKVEKKFGIILKDYQRKSLLSLYCGKDVFLSQPTGSGKSVCYQAFPYFHHYMSCHQTRKGDQEEVIKAIVVVVCPLIALMEDQMTSMKKKGVKGLVISSEKGEHEIMKVGFFPCAVRN